jgi:intein/homing endonuclease
MGNGNDVGLGHARRRLINKIVEQTWNVTDASTKTFTYRDVLYIIQEMYSDDGMKFLEAETEQPTNRGYYTFREFVKLVFYRNLANYDSMVLLTSDKGSGKCIYINSKNDFIVSANGDLVHPENAKEIVYMNEHLKLEIGKVKNNYSRNTDEVYEVILRSGKKICLTKEHPLRTILGWKQLQELKEGDFIATPRKYNLNNNETMNEGLVKVLAYLIADGFMGGRKLEFTKLDETIRKDFKKSLKQYDPTLTWGKSVRIVSKLPPKFAKNGCFLQRNTLINYLIKIGLYEKRSGDKFIPKEILVLNNDLISIFLNRLFSCDGCVESYKKNTHQVTYTSKSELLIRQLQHLLLRFEIHSKINSKFKRATKSLNHKGNYYWQLSISAHDNIENFYNKINFIHPDKKRKLEESYKISNTLKYNTNVDIIPKELLSNYILKHKSKEYATHFGIKLFNKGTFTKNNISRNRLMKFNELENNKELEDIIDSDLFWDRIETIKMLDLQDVKVYDLEINNKNHNFVCNDIIVHNSSAAIMLGREWCKIMGIRFSPARHIAYSNKDVTTKIEILNKFEPIIADEAIRFATAAEWAKRENKELKKKLAQIRTKHLFFILCFPLKIDKLEQSYRSSFVNYWIDLFGRGVGAIYVKDKNPVNEPWRLTDFKLVGSYTEFSDLSTVEKKLKNHPNFWRIIKFPRPPEWLYTKYLEVREKNVYNEEVVRETVTKEDIDNALLILALQDIMSNDTTLTIDRISLHIKNNYNLPITKQTIRDRIMDSKMLIQKIKEEQS